MPRRAFSRGALRHGVRRSLPKCNQEPGFEPAPPLTLGLPARTGISRPNVKGGRPVRRRGGQRGLRNRGSQPKTEPFCPNRSCNEPPECASTSVEPTGPHAGRECRSRPPRARRARTRSVRSSRARRGTPAKKNEEPAINRRCCRSMRRAGAIDYLPRRRFHIESRRIWGLLWGHGSSETTPDQPPYTRKRWVVDCLAPDPRIRGEKEAF